jgi:hypothetical protein
MSVQEIKDTIISRGFSNISEYIQWRRSPDKTLTVDDVLSPDRIDIGDFWKASHDMFETLPICGSGVNPAFREREIADRLNLHAALDTYGIFNNANFFFDKMTNVLEIGPGYGNLKAYIEEHYPHINYHGIDVCPMVDGVIKSDGRSIPDELKHKKYDFIFSANVFQHLSVAQRRGYYRDIGDVISDTGMFTFYMFVDNFLYPERMEHFHTTYNNGREYFMEHFGQFTKIQNINDIIDQVKEDAGVSAHDMKHQISSSVCTFTFCKNQSIFIENHIKQVSVFKHATKS